MPWNGYANQPYIPYPSPPLTVTPSYPPPIDIRRCRELPDVTGVTGQISLNPSLEYSSCLRPAGWSTVSPSNTNGARHKCPWATEPPLPSMTIILPSQQPVVVHRRAENFVTVGDVVAFMEEALQTPSPSGSRPVSPPVQRRENGEPLCPCELGSSAMIYLRSRYEKAGLEAHSPGTWRLRIRS